MGNFVQFAKCDMVGKLLLLSDFPDLFVGKLTISRIIIHSYRDLMKQM